MGYLGVAGATAGCADSVEFGGCGVGRSGPDRAVGRRGHAERGDRRLVGVSRPTVNAWRTRYAERGLPGLAEEKRAGRKRSIDQRRIVAETLRPPPASLGVTHWSSRLL